MVNPAGRRPDRKSGRRGKPGGRRRHYGGEFWRDRARTRTLAMMASNPRTTVAPMMLRGVKILPGESPAETVAATGLAEVPDFWPMLGVPLLMRVEGLPGDFGPITLLEAAKFVASRAALCLAYPSAIISLSVGRNGNGGGSDSVLGRT